MNIKYKLAWHLGSVAGSVSVHRLAGHKTRARLLRVYCSMLGKLVKLLFWDF